MYPIENLIVFFLGYYTKAANLHWAVGLALMMVGWVIPIIVRKLIYWSCWILPKKVRRKVLTRAWPEVPNKKSIKILSDPEEVTLRLSVITDKELEEYRKYKNKNLQNEKGNRT